MIHGNSPRTQPCCSALGVKHAGHIACGNKVPLGNLIRTMTEKMGARVDDRFYGGAHSGVIKELS